MYAPEFNKLCQLNKRMHTAAFQIVSVTTSKLQTTNFVDRMCLPQIHIYLDPQIVTLFENKVFTAVLVKTMRGGPEFRVDINLTPRHPVRRGEDTGSQKTTWAGGGGLELRFHKPRTTQSPQSWREQVNVLLESLQRAHTPSQTLLSDLQQSER